MFTDFFFKLRAKKIPVSTIELLDLIQSVKLLSQKKGYLTLDRLYNLSRSCLIKDIRYYDDFDIVFAEFFKNASLESDASNKLREWLENAANIEITDEKKANAMNLELEELLKELQKRLEEQKERHDGGNYWIGTSGTSAFGNSGFNPKGVKVGAGEGGGGRSAIWTFGDRKYREYRTDESLNVRQLKLALKRLKDLRKDGRLEFSIDKTIQKTCENGGDLDLVFSKSRKNKLKLMLLMDVGGSMSPHAERVSKLFSAAHQLNHFKEFHYYYFHNMVYEDVYKDANFTQKISLERLMKKISSDTKLIFVGDASMNPYELFGSSSRFGSYYSLGREDDSSPRTGMESLQMLLEFYKSSVWLNPDDRRYWNSQTCEVIWEEVPMFFLSVNGITEAVKELL